MRRCSTERLTLILPQPVAGLIPCLSGTGRGFSTCISARIVREGSKGEIEVADFASRLTGWIDGTIRWIGQSASWFCLVLVSLSASPSSCGISLVFQAWASMSCSGTSIPPPGCLVFLCHGRGIARTQRYSLQPLLRAHSAPDRLLRLLFLVLPFACLVIYHSYFFAEWAYLQNEGSIDPGGLSDRWIIKSALPIGFTIFAIATISRMLDLSAKIKAAKRVA